MLEKNYVLYNKSSYNDVLDYCKIKIYPNYNKVFHLFYGMNLETVLKLYECPNKHVYFDGDSTMFFEPFTLGCKYKNFRWISEYNQEYEALVIDHISSIKERPNSHLEVSLYDLDYWRPSFWKIKPIYFFTDLSEKEAKQTFNNVSFKFVDLKKMDDWSFYFNE